MLIGYARVSTTDQNLDLQLDALTKAGCEKIFAEKITGANVDRPELRSLKEFIRDNQDTVVVYKLDRLGRSLKNLIEEMQDLNARGIGFKSLQENIDTTTSGGRLFFHVFAALAEFERDIIKERTQAGLRAARSRGRLGGRPKKLTEAQVQLMRKLYADKANEIGEICKMFNIGRATLFRLVRLK
jgi:DNA invertase Pin-like site-specific DNA recombinase